MGDDPLASYTQWHDERYGDNSTMRNLGFNFNFGDYGSAGGGGGGMTEFDFWSTYGGMKIRQGNDPRLRYKTNKWGEFGYYQPYLNYGGVAGDGDENLSEVTVATKWVSLSNNKSQWQRFSGMGMGLMQTGDRRRLEKGKLGTESMKETVGFVLEEAIKQASKLTPGVPALNQLLTLTKSASRTLAGVGVLITIADAYLEGKWRTKHTIDASMGIIGAVFPVVGVIWFGANLISLANNGKTISENIQQYEDNLKEFDFTNVPLSFGRF